MNAGSLNAIASVARKEFIHIYRDRRVLWLLLILPPVFTLIFGHAFESGERKNVPALLINADENERTQRFVDLLLANETFAWRQQAPDAGGETDLLGKGVRGALIIPQGWSASLANGEPIALRMYLDGSDTSTGEQLQGSLQKTLGDFQMSERTELIDRLPDEVIQFGKQLPLDVRNEFVSAMEAWEVEEQVLYNPEERFIDYVLPGVIGIILQLITVTLMASTIARERESGTLYQLMVTALRRREIVIGKMLPYLAISAFLIVMIMLLAGWHFNVKFYQPAALGLICLLFLVCSLGLGLLISAISKSQTQAIQFSVFFLLPVFILSGAFAPLEQLPKAIASVAEFFPLTHFCRAFRLVNLYHADLSYYLRDLVVMSVGAVITFAGAVFLLKRIEQ